MSGEVDIWGKGGLREACLLPRPKDQGLGAGGGGGGVFCSVSIVELNSLLDPLHLGADSQRLGLLCSDVWHLPKSTGSQNCQHKWLAAGWEKHHSFLNALSPASLQSQNRQIMNELECCKNMHIINVYLNIEIYIFRERAFTMASSRGDDLGNSYPWPKERVCLSES